MTDIVPADQIETLVGARRHPTEHIARGDTATGRVYILHSAKCRLRYRDLRDCPWSLALDQQNLWCPPDEPVLVRLKAKKFVIAPLPKEYLLEVGE